MPPKKSKSVSSDEAPPPPGGKLPIFLVSGTDDLSALRKAEELVAKCCPPEEQAFGLEVIQGEGTEKTAEAACAILRNAIEALLTAPFLGGNKTVFLKNASFFDPLGDVGRFADVKAEVARLDTVLKTRLPEGVSFVVLCNKVNKATTFYKTFNTRGEVYIFDEPEKEKDAREDFYPHVEATLKAKGLTMRGDVLSAFIGRTGYSRRQVEMELEKLDLYLGDARRVVEMQDILLMVAPMTESKFWDFADAFCNLRPVEALSTAQRLFGQGISPVALIVNLQSALRDMVVFSDCLKRGWAKLGGTSEWPKLTWTPTAEAEAVLAQMDPHPQKMNIYRAAHVAAKAARVPPGRWFRWFNAAVDAQAAMTGGSAAAPEILLELFVVQTLGELQVDKNRRRP